MADVHFYEAFAEEREAIEQALGGGVSAGFTWKAVQEAGHAEPPAPVVSIRTQSVLPTAWAGKVRAVLSRSTGYDHLQAWRAASGRLDAPCGYLPLYCHRAVAEQAALLWMALLRRLPEQVRCFATFHRDGLTGGECQGRSLLVAGVGNIGHEVALIAKALGMAVQGADPVRKHEDVEYVEFDAALPNADVVVCAMSLNEGNVRYFDRARLSRAKQGAVFVNVARGEMAPAADLLRLLDEGRLGGVGLDVYHDERSLAVALRSGQELDGEENRATMELATRPNAILTPHNAFNTAEAVERKARQSVQQVRAFLETGEFLWKVP